MSDPKKKLGDNPLSPYRAMIRGDRARAATTTEPDERAPASSPSAVRPQETPSGTERRDASATTSEVPSHLPGPVGAFEAVAGTTPGGTPGSGAEPLAAAAPAGFEPISAGGQVDLGFAPTPEPPRPTASGGVTTSATEAQGARDAAPARLAAAVARRRGGSKGNGERLAVEGSGAAHRPRRNSWAASPETSIEQQVLGQAMIEMMYRLWRERDLTMAPRPENAPAATGIPPHSETPPVAPPDAAPGARSAEAPLASPAVEAPLASPAAEAPDPAARVPASVPAPAPVATLPAHDALERAAAERGPRNRRQKTFYLSDDVCERLRELSFRYRLDQSTIVEQALGDFLREREPRSG